MVFLKKLVKRFVSKNEKGRLLSGLSIGIRLGSWMAIFLIARLGLGSILTDP